MMAFGRAAHGTLGRLAQESAYRASNRLENGRVLDAFKFADDFLEFKPASAPGIGKGLPQIEAYERTLGPGATGTLVPYPAPWAPEFWPYVSPAFAGGF